MANKKDARYWEQRAERTAERGYLEGDALADQLKSAYQLIADDLSKEVESFYSKYAVEGAVDYGEALKPLTPKELGAFRRKVSEFIKNSLGKVDFRWFRRLQTYAQQKKVARLESLLVQAQHQVEIIAVAQQTGMTAHLANTYQAAYYRSMYDVQAGANVATTFAKLDTRSINTAVARGWDGSNYSSRTWANRDKLVNELRTLMPRAIAQGKSVQSSAGVLSKIMNTAKNVAERLIRTETANILQESTFESYTESGVVGKYRNLATLDKKTSDICKEMDGTEFDLADKEVGITAPPFHVNCRTTTVVVFEDFKAPDEKRIARDKDGNNILVDADTTYPQWANMMDVKPAETNTVIPPDDRAIPTPETASKADIEKAQKVRAQLERFKSKQLGGE